MSTQEQQRLKEEYYEEAIRHMNNAKECLVKAKKEEKFYRDRKYVKMACGTAYSGVLVALDCFLMLKDIPAPKGKLRRSIEYYQLHLGQLDRKMLDYLNGAYQTLHLYGYYDGTTVASVVKDGFDLAYAIIDKIKPTALHTS